MIPQNAYGQNNTAANFIQPMPLPQPLIVAQNSQIRNASNNIVDKLEEKLNKIQMENELNKLKDEKHKLEQERLMNEMKHINEKIDRTHTDMMITTMGKNNPQNININNTQIQGPLQVQPSGVISATTIVRPNGRLKYSSGFFCLFLGLNCILPGLGTIIAGAMFGGETDVGNRTGELICHGLLQLLTAVIIVGWIWAIMDAAKYFDKDSCC